MTHNHQATAASAIGGLLTLLVLLMGLAAAGRLHRDIGPAGGMLGIISGITLANASGKMLSRTTRKPRQV